MLTKDCLPLLDLDEMQNPATILSLRLALLKYGAFRLRAPELNKAFTQGILYNAQSFFQLPKEIKHSTGGYSAFGTELIRGETPIPKESIYFRKKEQENRIHPPSDLYLNIGALHDLKEWRHLRGELFRVLSRDILNSDIPLTGNPILDHESIGLHYYDPQKMSFETDYIPPHMDAGTLTILVRYPGDHDGLGVADLDSTDKRGSEGVGQEASFLRIPAALDEVVVFAGTRMQRLFGRSKVRACVHRVCGPSQADKHPRLSLGIFCAAPAV
ncbi:hypothetical protein N7474_008613 [Penicillium riverlandense]|uniref:uncharacterized protein n=1 Tax=Penicillium riverlandense TaxID=1903569 RepID=UPI002548A271|nr:uncharacterized protein N7474_008613 [Penicillium riverlandense]KAJ5812312.1 hypothetical protein N7474_008613 [Penicillium riverlandense]